MNGNFEFILRRSHKSIHLKWTNQTEPIRGREPNADVIFALSMTFKNNKNECGGHILELKALPELHLTVIQMVLNGKSNLRHELNLCNKICERKKNLCENGESQWNHERKESHRRHGR